jgi:multiple sugar transport system ATP-binding protein
MAEITLERVGMRYPDGTVALRPTDLVIADGELFILVGPSGCGKSTLLKLICGLERPTSGEIRVDGEAVTDRDPKDRNMAMVFQSYAIYPHMTVRENMAFPLRLAKLPAAEIAERVGRAAEILGLGGLLERKPAALSGGQRQRVAMGRAIVREPAAFLLDEPLSNLDAKLRAQMRTELARLQRRLGTTTVYVTHDQTEAMTLGERIAVLRGGAVQQVGTPRELYRSPANLFVAGFIGAPAMNLLPGEVRGGRLRLPMLELPLPGPLRLRLGPGPTPVIAGIRPEHLEPADAPETGAVEIGGAQAAPGPQTRSAVFPAVVELVEWLGAELYLHFDVQVAGDDAGTAATLAALRRELELSPSGGGRFRLVARLGPDRPVAEGDRVPLRCRPDGLVLFDPESGARIGRD